MSCRPRRSAAGRLALPLVALVLAACGGGAGRPAATGHAAVAVPAGPCVNAVRAAVAAETGTAVSTRVTAVSLGQATCVYEAPRLRIDVLVDANPQAETRFERAVVERGQNAVWGHNQAKQPVQIHGIGVGADWFPADRQLLTTDGRRLIVVSLIRPAHATRHDLRVGKAAARGTLAGKTL